MNIHLANHSKQGLGGGWTFLANFAKYLGRLEGIHLVPSDLGADVIFISGATMVERNYISKNKAQGKKIVLRVDNIPKNSRNRNTGTSRLKDFAEMADLVVYQSEWAKEYIMPFIKRDGPVIINGADHEIFKPNGNRQPKEGSRQYAFIQYNRDETKQWHQAWYEFQMRHRSEADAHLWLIGQFSPENVQYNFDFYMGEKFRHVGVIGAPADMAEYLRSVDCLLVPYFNDACSNTIIEARLCGVQGFFQNGSGGNRQILTAPLEQLTARRMVDDYVAAIKKLF